MKRTKRWGSGLLILLLLAGTVWFHQTPDVQAANYPPLVSAADLYNKLVDQINDREVTRYYTVRNADMAKSLVHMDMEAFQAHYNEKDPLNSGCYLCYYLDTIYLSFQGSTFKIMIRYPYSKKEMDDHFEKMRKLAVQLKGSTDYDTIQNVHDYLIENFEYDQKTSMVNHTDIDGFRDGVMVCSGYSLAAYYLLNSVGISTRVVTGYGGDGTGRDENHMWNMVQLDGKWYNMDITWDDPGGDGKAYTYFLKNDEDFTGHVRLGAYSPEKFTITVADESYKLPFSLRFVEHLELGMKILALILGITILLVILSVQKKRRTAATHTGYVVYQPELFENEDDTHV